jgi:glycosyltransferase involved in cell wall biosynthesis
MNLDKQLLNLVSIVIPARNASSTIAALFRSLVADRALIFEILLIDDGSEDCTVEVARDAAQRYHLPLHIHQVSFGKAGAARNFGIAHARGQFLFFIDADDALIPGSLKILAIKLIENSSAGLALGACIRQTPNRQDKIKIPHGYSDDCQQNVHRYLANELWPIAMGSALVVAAQATGIRFPETIGLDEDTCYWAALLSRVRVVISTEPVLLYQLDEARMAQRFISSPRRTLLGISRALKSLARQGIANSALKDRIAWVALRITRQLIIAHRYSEAHAMLRLPRRHPRFRSSWKVLQYSFRIKCGLFLQRMGIRHEPVALQLAQSKEFFRTFIITIDDASIPISGADLRNHQNALSAAKLGSVQVVSIRPESAASSVSIEGIAFSSVGVVNERSKSLSSRRCRGEIRIPRAVLPRLKHLIRDFRPDSILIEGVPLAMLIKHLRPLTRQIILDMHNIESALVAQKQTRRARKDAARIRRLEKKAILLVDRIWVCSEQDQDCLIKTHFPARPIYVVPNSIPRDGSLQNETSKSDSETGPVMLLVAHLGYWPNVQAAERLVKRILPIVKSALPSAKVILVGRHPCASVQSLAELPSVELHANPDILAPFYARADCAVIPLEAGGGTRIKALEAAALRLPIVATPLAVEGLGLIDREDILLADSDEGLAQHVIKLFQDTEQGLRLTDSAERTVRFRFGETAVNFAVKKGLL